IELFALPASHGGATKEQAGAEHHEGSRLWGARQRQKLVVASPLVHERPFLVPIVVAEGLRNAELRPEIEVNVVLGDRTGQQGRLRDVHPQVPGTAAGVELVVEQNVVLSLRRVV